jgi:hypothetical protein
MERCAWELDQLIQELQGLPQALISNRDAPGPYDAVQHRRTLRRLDRVLQQYASWKRLPETNKEEEGDAMVDPSSIPRKLVFLFSRLSLPMPPADDAPSRIEELTLSILQRIQSFLADASTEEALEWFSDADVQMMLQQVLYHHSGGVATSPQPWHPAVLRPVVIDATALWLPALTAYFQERRASDASARNAIFPHLTQVLPIGTSMIQYLASSSDDAPERSTAMSSSVFQWHALTQSMLQYVLVPFHTVSQPDSVGNPPVNEVDAELAANLGAALSTYLTELTEYTLDVLDAATLISKDTVMPNDCLAYVGLTSELWMSLSAGCRPGAPHPVLPTSSLQPIFLQQFVHFWKALATAFMTSPSKPQGSSLLDTSHPTAATLCCHQLQCTELLLSVLWTNATTDAAVSMQKYEPTLLLVLLRALSFPHLLVQSKRLWDYLRITPRSVPTTRLLQATLLTYTRQHWGILQPAANGSDEASPHRLVAQRMGALLEAPGEEGHNAWDRFFWKHIRNM